MATEMKRTAVIRKTKLLRSHTPIRRVGTKRRHQLKEYSRLRKEYIARHPWCEAYCIRFKIDYDKLFEQNGAYREVSPDGFIYWRNVPLADDIHHTAGRTGWRLNDTTKWLAVSRTQHMYIHDHPSEARALGLLE